MPVFPPIGTNIFWAPPLFHLIAAGLFKTFSVFGYKAALKSMNFVSPLFGIATLFVFYSFVKNFLNRRIALYSTFFFSIVPIHFYYSTISHIDAMITFFVMYSIYLVNQKRYNTAAIVCGLGMLTKYNFGFVYPVLLYLIFSGDTKSKIRQFLKITIIPFVIAIPWLVRNALYLGNPFYHFFNSIFRMIGFEPFKSGVDNIAHRPIHSLFDIQLITKPFLDFFGVPLGLISNLKYVDLPFMPWPFYAWLIICFAFFIPLLIGLFCEIRTKNSKYALLIWIISFFIMLALYVYDFRDIYLRLALPAIPALAIFWGMGFDGISKKLDKKWVFLILLIFSVTFFASESFKAYTAYNVNAKYLSDYEWFRENIPDDSLIMPANTRLVYYTDHLSVNKYSGEIVGQIYYWKFGEDQYTTFKSIYKNKRTGVEIFKSAD